MYGNAWRVFKLKNIHMNSENSGLLHSYFLHEYKQVTNQKFFTIVKDHVWDYQHIKQNLLI